MNKGIYTPDMDPPISKLTENIRDLLIQARGQIHDITHSKKPLSDRVEDVSGLLTCGIVTLHHAIEEMAEFEIKRDDNRMGKSLQFGVRGIGLDMCPCCYVCGRKNRHDKTVNDYLNNISAFVKSKEEGEKIVVWFEKDWTFAPTEHSKFSTARLDFRPSEPNWIQVKVGACDEHVHCLEDLTQRCENNHGRIRKIDIIESRKAVKSEGEKSEVPS